MSLMSKLDDFENCEIEAHALSPGTTPETLALYPWLVLLNLRGIDLKEARRKAWAIANEIRQRGRTCRMRTSGFRSLKERLAKGVKPEDEPEIMAQRWDRVDHDQRTCRIATNAPLEMLREILGKHFGDRIKVTTTHEQVYQEINEAHRKLPPLYEERP